MIEPERGEDHVPGPDEAEKENDILDFHPHGQKLNKGDRAGLVIHYPSGQGKRKDHDEQVKQLEGFEYDLTAERSHWQ